MSGGRTKRSLDSNERFIVGFDLVRAVRRWTSVAEGGRLEFGGEESGLEESRGLGMGYHFVARGWVGERWEEKEGEGRERSEKRREGERVDDVLEVDDQKETGF